MTLQDLIASKLMELDDMLKVGAQDETVYAFFERAMHDAHKLGATEPPGRENEEALFAEVKRSLVQ